MFLLQSASGVFVCFKTFFFFCILNNYVTFIELYEIAVVLYFRLTLSSGIKDNVRLLNCLNTLKLGSR